MPRKADPSNVLAFTRSTATTVQLAAGQQERTVWDLETPGFGLRIRAGGSRVWVIRPAPSSGKYSLVTLGPTSRVSYAQARDAAREQLAKAHLGEGPREARAAARAPVTVVTLSTYFEQYLERAKSRLKAANQKTLERHLRHDFAALASFPIADIRRAHVAQCLDEITVRAPATANRARSQLSTFFVWAIGQGLTETNPVIGTNKPAKDVRRSRVLSATELATVWRVVGDDDFGRIIRLLILTGQRRNEVARMVWDELDLDAGVWTIPAERAKNGRVHEVPLSEPALAILRTCSMREGVPYLFGRNRTGPFSGFSAAKDRLDAAVQLRTPWVIHDLRRTLATGMNDLKVPPHIVEAVINHVSGAKGGVAGTYNWALYREEKREALDLWAAHVLKLGQPPLQVVTTDTEATFAEA